jgi:hypothetical protein
MELPPIYGMFGMIFCMSLTYYPFVFLLSHGAFSSANALLEDAGMLMGASRWRVLRTITFPLVIPSIGAAALLVFIRSIGNFGIPRPSGGSVRPADLDLFQGKRLLGLERSFLHSGGECAHNRSRALVPEICGERRSTRRFRPPMWRFSSIVIRLYG